MNRTMTATLCIFGIFAVCCRQQVLPVNTTQGEKASSMKPADDTALINDIKTFTADVGQEGEKAWKRLRSIPRDELIRRLLDMRSRLDADDSMRPRIAFVLCNLDYEYLSNAKIVASALSRETKYRNFYADDAAGLIIRLIDRGDKSLWPVLLSSAAWADGALAEQLGDTIGDRLLNDTDTLLEVLNAQPKEIRVKVYRLIGAEGAFSPQDRQLITGRLRTIRPKAKAYPVAQELLSSVFDH
jgi:hypothetical protein